MIGDDAKIESWSQMLRTPTLLVSVLAAYVGAYLGTCIQMDVSDVSHCNNRALEYRSVQQQLVHASPTYHDCLLDGNNQLDLQHDSFVVGLRVGYVCSWLPQHDERPYS